MSKDRSKQLALFRMFQSLAKTQEPTTIEAISSNVGWAQSTTRTYLRKQFQDYINRNAGQVFVKPEFARVSERQFLSHTTQNRPVYSEYHRVSYEQVVVYEFLLPMSQEQKLRPALDELFFGDTLEQRIKEIGTEDIQTILPRHEEEAEASYVVRVAEKVSHLIGGYSISRVEGRFRAESLCTRHEAGELYASNKPYIIDETTAVVRFIIPCHNTLTDHGDTFDLGFDTNVCATLSEITGIRKLFFGIFVEAVVRNVQGEAEIWLLETTNTRRLYVWRRNA